MTLTQTSQPARPPAYWGSVALLALSGLMAVTAFGGAMTLALIGVFGLGGSAATGGRDATTMFVLAWSSILTGLLLAPAVVLSGLNLLNRPIPGWMQRAGRLVGRLLPWSIVIWPILIVLGILLGRIEPLDWLLLPPVHVLAVALPVFWLVSIALRGLSAGRPLRGWGLFSTSLSVNPILMIAIELSIFALIGIAAIVWIASRPELQGELMRLAQRLATVADNPDAAARVLQPILARPAVAGVAILLMAGIVPLIEEMFKPLALWLVAWRKMTPAQGFAGGVLCGAGLALVESLGATSNFSTETWGSIVVQRAGTDLLHITTTGMVGWALVSAWQQRKYLRLVLAYLGAVAIHGAWNAISLWSGFSGITGSEVSNGLPLVLLGALAGLMFGLLLSFNQRLRRKDSPAVAAAYPIENPPSGETVSEIAFNDNKGS